MSAIRNRVPTRGLHHVTPHIVALMQTIVAGRTDKALTAQFGISYNTWRKVLAGEPIRASLLIRLEARVEKLETSQFQI